jgi:aminoglycoside phosphotransferase (APT) family kinase protein
MVCHPVVLQHGDLWYENLLMEEGRLSGVLDFEQLALGDAAADFAVQLYLGETFTQQLIQTYQRLGGKLDQHLEYWMPRLLALRELEGLAFAVQSEIEAALSKIRRSCIFV